jgi:hypothetical protein
MLSALDRAAHGGAETGRLARGDVRTALRAYFRVGQPGGKTEARFDEMMQALDAVSGGGGGGGEGAAAGARERGGAGEREPMVAHAALFAEDREFNQGEFAETVRDQALSERLEFFAEAEAALVAQAAGAAAVTRAHVAAALGLVDPALTAAQAWDRANAAFEPGVAASGVEAVMRRLKAGGGRRLRLSSAVAGGGGGGGGSVFGGGGSVMAGGGSKGGLGLKAAARAALLSGSGSSSSSASGGGGGGAGPVRLSSARGFYKSDGGVGPQKGGGGRFHARCAVFSKTYGF